MLDNRSLRVIATLLPPCQEKARALYDLCKARNIGIQVISGLRTYNEQDALYAQGRTAPGKIVTNARGGYSNHNFGIAFDVGVFRGGAYLGESPLYRDIGKLGKSLGLSWGGDWESFKDLPHFEFRPDWAKGMNNSQMLTELRNRVRHEIPIYGNTTNS